MNKLKEGGDKKYWWWWRFCRKYVPKSPLAKIFVPADIERGTINFVSLLCPLSCCDGDDDDGDNDDGDNDDGDNDDSDDDDDGGDGDDDDDGGGYDDNDDDDIDTW